VMLPGNPSLVIVYHYVPGFSTPSPGVVLFVATGGRNTINVTSVRFLRFVRPSLLTKNDVLSYLNFSINLENKRHEHNHGGRCKE
jgi:hypothetical protein